MRRALLIGGTLCVAGGLLLTFSRGAWVGVGAGAAVYGGLRVGIGGRRNPTASGSVLRFRDVVRAVVAVAVFITLLLSFDKVSKTLAERGTLEQMKAFKTDPRGVAYAQAAGMVMDHPLLGTGTAHYRYLAKRYGDYDGTPDNGYLRILAENGILGLGAMIAVFAALLKGLFRCVREATGPDFRASLAAVLAASFSGFYVDMITCDALQFPLTRLTFWMLAGVAMSLGHRQPA
jgi:O-antigen ligase